MQKTKMINKIKIRFKQIKIKILFQNNHKLYYLKCFVIDVLFLIDNN